MNANRPHRLDRAAAERLLGGGLGPQDSPDALTRLLAVASAPARPAELTGEDAAVAAFREAHLRSAPLPRRRSMLETAMAKLLTLKVAAAAAVAAAATGGVALAAADGTLPDPVGDGKETVRASPTAAAPERTQVGGTDQGKPSTTPDAKGGGTPSPSTVGLCHAFKAGAADNPGKAVDNPAFTALATAAGSREKIAAYCDALLATGKTPKTPGGAAPTVRPGGKPEVQPTGKPESLPGNAPTARPTVRPTR